MMFKTSRFTNFNCEVEHEGGECFFMKFQDLVLCMSEADHSSVMDIT